jgi:hypothetical protein
MALVLFTFSLPALGEEAGRFPKDWYELPEDGYQLKASSNEVNGVEERKGLIFRRGLPFVRNSLDHLYESSVEALDESSPTLGRRDPPPNAPADWVPWHLKEIIMDLGVSLQGTIGVVAAKGAVSAEVYWKQKPA